MQSLNILIRPQQMFLDAVAARLQVRLIKLDRVLSFDNRETEGNIFVRAWNIVAEAYKGHRAKFPLFFSSRRDRTDPITRIRFYFYDGRPKLISGNLANSVSDSCFSILSLSSLLETRHTSSGEGQLSRERFPRIYTSLFEI